MAFGALGQGQQQGPFGQGQQQGPFGDQNQLFRQFMMEMLGQAPPSPPFSGGGRFQPGQVQGGQVLPPQPVQQPVQPQPQQQQPQQAPPQQSQPLQPAPQPVQQFQPAPQPQLQQVQRPQPAPIFGPVGVQGPLPGMFSAGVGQTISGTSTPGNVLSNALFG